MIRRIAFVCIILWLSFWLYTTRYAMLDDALIHLRYAANLHDLHLISYDGLHKSFGTSSLLYVALLAVLRSITTSPLLPKVVSVLAYLGVVLVAMVLRLRARARQQSILSASLLAVLLCPMAIRWLTDGMETSLMALAVMVFAIAAQRGLGREHLSAAANVGLCALGFVLVVLRVEFALLAAILSLALLAQRWRVSKTKAILSASPVSVGAVAAMAFVHSIFGSLLPDTAVAKAGGASLSPLVGILRALASSLLLGTGLLVLWIVSLVLIRRQFKASTWLLMNAPLPIVALLACMRGQSIQGVRYVLWCLVFSTVFNIASLTEGHESHSFNRKWIVAAIAIFVMVLPIDGLYAWRTLAGRGETYRQMHAADFSMFRTQTLVAGDVGFIGYFTNAQICDLNGLVNGRDAASRTTGQRSARCAALKPDIVFMNDFSARNFASFLPVEHWTVCASYDFPNVHGSDVHYLAVRDPGRFCPSASTRLDDALQVH